MVAIEFDAFDETQHLKHGTERKADATPLPTLHQLVHQLLQLQQQRTRLHSQWYTQFRQYVDTINDEPTEEHKLNPVHKHYNNTNIAAENDNGLDAISSKQQQLDEYTQYCTRVTAEMNDINSGVRLVSNHLLRLAECAADSEHGGSTSAAKQTTQQPSYDSIQLLRDQVHHIQQSEQQHLAAVLEYQAILHQHVVMYRNEFSVDCSDSLQAAREKINAAKREIAEVLADIVSEYTYADG